jgi:membrane-associated phospholipid phosphatase
VGRLAILVALALAGAVIASTAITGAHPDAAVAQWAADHVGPAAHGLLAALTQAGGAPVVIVLAILLAVGEFLRTRRRSVLVFVTVVALGNHLVTSGVKAIVDRPRPTFDPAALTLGPSFPSGHSSTAAAFYAAVALLVGRRLAPPARSRLFACAVAIAVAVAATRVLLTVHWLSDAFAGLALGWAWFGLCVVVFRPRALSSPDDVVRLPATPANQEDPSWDTPSSTRPPSSR